MYSFKLCQEVGFVPTSVFPDEPASGLRYVNERNEKQGGFPPAAGVTVFCPILRTRPAPCGPAPGPTSSKPSGFFCLRSATLNIEEPGDSDYRTNFTCSISENSRSPVKNGISSRFATEYPTQSIVESFFPLPDASFLNTAPEQ